MTKTFIAILCACFAATASAAAADANALLSQAVDQLLKAYSSKSVDQFLTSADPE
jgi:hypothetical protein